MKSIRYRKLIPESRRIVVKIGTRVLVDQKGKLNHAVIENLVFQLSKLHKEEKELLVITSGAIASGMEALNIEERPKELPDLQMAAAVGQGRLISVYQSFFNKHNIIVGQVLLTHNDFKHKIRLTNARRTLENLIRHKIIPIINENDAISDEEIKADMALGDNDLLAALVVKLVRADLLIILTTVDGVLKETSTGIERLSFIENITPKIFALCAEKTDSLSRGGMKSKLKAAKIAAETGCISVIANGLTKDILLKIFNGEDIGTLILASGL